jgi:YHS domain-containing protein
MYHHDRQYYKYQNSYFMTNIKKLFSVVYLLIVANGFSQINPIDKNKIANGGYDVVAYFKQNKALKGDKKIESIYNETKYYFSNQENKIAFVENPTKYLPQCDGFCAYGVSEKNAKVSINPETFKIINGKLYLFYNDTFLGTRTNTLIDWNKTETIQLSKIDANWLKLKSKK